MSNQQNKLESAPEGLIILTMHGDQTPESVHACYEEMMAIIATQPGVSHSVLVDVKDIGSHTMSVRSLAKDLIPKSPVRRVAITGATLALKVTINLIIRTIQSAEHIRVFDSREEALLWLNV